MKFLTLLKFKPGLQPDPKMVIAVNEAAKGWIKAQIAQGALESVFNVVPNAAGYYGMSISNASSLEAVTELLVSYPGYPMTDFEVYPLSDVYKAIDDVTAAVRKMMGAMGG
jgi:hypothetical protein